MSKIDVVTIDTGVPVPETTGKGRPSIWPIDQLGVGESFVFPADKRQTIASAASRKKEGGKEFTIKKQDDTSYRIWRIK